MLIIKRRTEWPLAIKRGAHLGQQFLLFWICMGRLTCVERHELTVGNGSSMPVKGTKLRNPLVSCYGFGTSLGILGRLGGGCKRPGCSWSGWVASVFVPVWAFCSYPGVLTKLEHHRMVFRSPGRSVGFPTGYVFIFGLKALEAECRF